VQAIAETDIRLRVGGTDVDYKQQRWYQAGERKIWKDHRNRKESDQLNFDALSLKGYVPKDHILYKLEDRKRC
jgi:hypothetical protein